MQFNLFGIGKKKEDKVAKIAEDKVAKIAKENFIKGAVSFFDFLNSYHGYSGDKIDFNFGGFGKTRASNNLNLYGLQTKSEQLYNENPYAASIVNRIVTKTVNAGYGLRSTPIKKVLNFLPENFLKEFKETSEALFWLWSEDRRLVSIQEDKTFGEIQSLAMKSSLIFGDCLCINYYNKATGLPVVELIEGKHIRSPYLSRNIIDGIEYNPKGQIEAYHVAEVNVITGEEKFKRVLAKDRSGKVRAWLVKSGNSRVNNARGIPLLAVVLQNLNDVGRYLDSEQRAALVNSYVAVVHQKDADMPDNVERFLAAGTDHTVTVQEDTVTKDLNFKKINPGFFATNLERGESIKSFDTSRPNVNFGTFTDIVTKPMFYVHGIPPEVLKMEYNSNYSASRAAIIDFETTVREKNYYFNGSLSAPIYHNWLDMMILKGEIKAPGYIEAINNVGKWPIVGAYRSHIWRGLPKINIDGFKQAKENEINVRMGLTTCEQIADEQFGTDYLTNMEQRRVEAKLEKEIDDIKGVNDGNISAE